MSITTPSESAIGILRRVLTDPGYCPSAADVAAIDEAYPYLAVAASLRLKRSPARELTPGERRRLVMKVAMAAPGRDTLFRLTDPDGELLSGFMPAEKSAEPTASTTDSAIDTFLDRYGRMSPGEEALLEKLIFNPVPDDYSAVLAREEGVDMAPQPLSEQDKKLDAFLAAAPSAPVIVEQEKVEIPIETAEVTQVTPATAPELRPAPRHAPQASHVVNPSSSLSESLAQVYIRRGRYDKAYDIILALSLNNPKKSVYFADQLRFLQKLMLNQRYGSARSDS